jgi:hypothetical protein
MELLVGYNMNGEWHFESEVVRAKSGQTSLISHVSGGHFFLPASW